VLNITTTAVANLYNYIANFSGAVTYDSRIVMRVGRGTNDAFNLNIGYRNLGSPFGYLCLQGYELTSALRIYGDKIECVGVNLLAPNLKSDNETRLVSSESNIVSLNIRMNGAESNIDNLDGRVTTNENDISGLETRMTTAESNITGLAGVYAQAREDIINLDSRVTVLEEVGPENHNSLLNIQGGTSLEYYHLTNAKYTDVNNLDFDLLQNITGSVSETSTTFDGNLIADNVASTNLTDIGNLQTKTQNFTATSGNTQFTGTINGCAIKTDGSSAPARPYFGIIKTDGLLEGGRYFDWNYVGNESDRTSRTQIDSNGNLIHDHVILGSGFEMNSTSNTFGTNMISVLRALLYPVGAVVATEGDNPGWGYQWDYIGRVQTTPSGNYIYYYRRAV